MYKLLNEKELEVFINRYFKEYKNDIKKVSLITYKGINEYLVNDHYIFIVRD